MNIEIRRATQEDAEQLAPLIYQAAPRLLDFTFGCVTGASAKDITGQRGIRFIEYCFSRDIGFYAKRFQYVGCMNDKIVLVCTLYPAHLYLNLVKEALIGSIKSLGVIQTARMTARSWKIQSLFTTPDDDALFIANLAVIPEMRGKGLATSFIESVALAQCTDGITHMCLDVGIDNPGAQRLYERMGFSVQKINPYKGTADISGVIRMRRAVRTT